jgi:hypothetical protein
MPAANLLAGEGVMFAQSQQEERALRLAPTSGRVASNVVTDGTEWAVALLVLGALAFLIMLEVGGFRPLIAVRG